MGQTALYCDLLKQRQELEQQMKMQRKVWHILEEERFTLDKQIEALENGSKALN